MPFHACRCFQQCPGMEVYFNDRGDRFFGCRAFSFVLDLLCMRVGVGTLLINDKVMKLVSNVIVVIVNYVFSKLIVFRKPKENH